MNECKRQLLEAGADPTISPPRRASFAMGVLYECQKVIGDLSKSDQRSDFDKETLATLLHYAFEFVAFEVDPCKIVDAHMSRQGWTPDSVAHLLQLSGSKLPIQDLTCTLTFAIRGSLRVDESGLLGVLILLIRNGADMTHHGHWISEIACCPQTRYKLDYRFPRKMFDPFCLEISNCDLKLRRIWAEALATCGYDAEEYISQSTRFEELSKTNDEGSEDNSGTTSDEDDISTAQYIPPSPHFEELSEIDDERREGDDRAVSNEDDISTAGYISQSTRFEGMCDTNDEGCEDPNGTISDEDDTSTAEEPSQPPGLDEAFNGASASETDDTSQPSGTARYNSIDWALLEEDTLVWRD